MKLTNNIKIYRSASQTTTTWCVYCSFLIGQFLKDLFYQVSSQQNYLWRGRGQSGTLGQGGRLKYEIKT